jgi:translation initiation factor 5A
MSDDETFDVQEEQYAGTFPISVNDLRVGSHIVISGNPCRIINIDKFKTGKHGAAKANITGLDIFNGNKYLASYPTSHNAQGFKAEKTQYTLLDINDNCLSLMDNNGETREDINIPEDNSELVDNMNKLFNDGETVIVTVLSALGREKVMECKRE